MLDYFDSQTSKFLLITILAGMVFFGLIFYFLKKLGKSPKNILPVNFAGNMRLPLALFMLALVLKIIKTNDRILEFIEENFLSHVSTLLFILSITWILIVILKAFKRNNKEISKIKNQKNEKNSNLLPFN